MTATTEAPKNDAQVTPMEQLSACMKQFRAARQVSTPLIAITTPDPTATIQNIRAAATTKKFGVPPIVCWDIMQGIRPITPKGYEAIVAMCMTEEDAKALPKEPEKRAAAIIEAGSMKTNPAEAMHVARYAPQQTIFILMNAHLYLSPDAPDVQQAAWNLRDLYKGATIPWRTLVLLAPSLTPPASLAQDLLVIDEPLPNEDELGAIANSILNSGGITPTPELTKAIISATTGLSAFSAEQVIAMSVSQDAATKQTSIDVQAVWERKRRTIEQVPGLSVWRGGENFASIGGSDNCKRFMARYLERNETRVVLWLDEIEKMFGGSTGDSSGVTQEMLGKILTWMQDEEVTGSILIGPPGSGKSMMAKAAGNQAQVPTVACNIADMKAGIVGQSNQQLAAALKTVSAIAGKKGKILAIATCNQIAGMPPELLGRFRLPTFFFDLPNADERAVIWDLYIKKYNLDPTQQIPDSEGWAGRDIQKCTENAAIMGFTLMEAAEFVVNVTQSSGNKIEKLRQECSGKYVSASYPGTYHYRTTSTRPSIGDEPSAPRAIDRDE